MMTSNPFSGENAVISDIFSSLKILLSVLSKSFMASCQFVEELFVQRVILLSVSRGHEDVAADVLVHDLTICRHTAEGHVHITIELNSDLESGAE